MCSRRAAARLLTVVACAAVLGACSGDTSATIDAEALAAQAAVDLTAETGTPTEVRCPDGITLDEELTGRLVCESRYDSYPWSEILVIVRDYDPETGAFETIFANPPA